MNRGRFRNEEEIPENWRHLERPGECSKCGFQIIGCPFKVSVWRGRHFIDPLVSVKDRENVDFLCRVCALEKCEKRSDKQKEKT